MKKFLHCTYYYFSIGNFSRMFRRGNSITVAVPNETNEARRALLLLQEKGYITLKEGAGITVPYDIAENPKNIQFREVAQVPNVLQDVDYAVINPIMQFQPN